MLTYLPTQSEQLDAVFSALSNPIRRSIIEQLANRDCTVNELAEPHSISRPGVSQHLRVLEKAGLVEQTIDGRIRRCSLNVQPLSNAFTWLVRYRVFWEKLLDEIQDKVEEDEEVELKK